MTLAVHSNIDALAYLRENNTLPIVSVIAIEFAVMVSKWATRRRTRLALSQLTEAQLDDVGLTSMQARRESARLFWQT